MNFNFKLRTTLFTSAVLIASAIASQSAQAQVSDRPWESLQCSSAGVREAREFSDYMRSRVRAADDYARFCEGADRPEPVPNDCIQYLVEKGHGPTRARETCQGMIGTEVDCLKRLIERGYGLTTARTTCLGLGEVASDCIEYMLGKGYGPQTARQSCEGQTHASFECVKYVTEKGYGPATGKTTCDGVRYTEFECIKGVMEKGHGPSTARSTCIGAPR